MPVIQKFRVWLLTAVLALGSTIVHAAGDEEEFVLNFSHPAVGNFYVSAIYSQDQVYLPVSELFKIFYINLSDQSSAHHLHGQWLKPGTEWSVNVVNLMATVEKKNFVFTVDDYRIGAMDIYLSPALYEKIFGFRFEVNMNALSLKVNYEGRLPIEDKKKREALRKRLLTKDQNEKNYPNLFPRKPKFLGLGFMDYYLEGNRIGNENSVNYNFHTGVEFLGGDLQGSFFGSALPDFSRVFTSNVRWRFNLGENKYMTSLIVGQTSTTSTIGEQIIGVAVNNEPIRPRQIFHTYQVDGTTIPDSEVELYVNEQLADFTRANEFGYYRFNFPLTYGTVKMSTRIYTPSGQIIIEDRRLQIPFNFLPQGVLTYNLQAGYPDLGTGLNIDQPFIAHGDMGIGITPALTARVGLDYTQNDTLPVYYGSMVARLFNNFLVSVDVAPDQYYRANANYIMYYGNSIDLSYVKFNVDNFDSPGLVSEELKLGLFLPVRILGWNSGFRFSGTQRNTSVSNNTLLQADYNTNIGKINLRLNYRDQLFRNGTEFFSTGNRLATAAFTYTISRSPGIPVFAKGMFVRGQFAYDLSQKEPTTVGLQLSRSIKNVARINLMADYDLRFDKLRLQASVQMDLRFTRMGSQYNMDAGSHSFKQTFSGSMGLDVNSKDIRFSDRENVGRAAASVIMFLDENENRKFDEGEKIVPGNAIRMQQFTTSKLGKDGILRLSQLQAYWNYQVEVVMSSMPDPTLAPLFTQFSFVADPNQYKRIEIPVYKAGIMEGSVTLVRDGENIPLSGVRVLLKSQGREWEETLKTFSDGAFYSLNLIPGKYTLEIDKVQLDFLQAVSEPAILEFEVKASMDGDYIPDLNFIVREQMP